MVVKIVGIQNQDYKLDNGYAFKGKKLHVIDCESVPNGLEGNLVTTLKIADDSPMANVPVEIGKRYTVYFNQKGGLDYITDYVQK